jgi:hypothetical protein
MDSRHGIRFGGSTAVLAGVSQFWESHAVGQKQRQKYCNWRDYLNLVRILQFGETIAAGVWCNGLGRGGGLVWGNYIPTPGQNNKPTPGVLGPDKNIGGGGKGCHINGMSL